MLRSPPAPGGKKKTGLVIGGVAVLVAIGVGVYFVVGNAGSSGLADDGPHKLTTPAKVLGDYNRATKDGDTSDSGSSTVKDLEKSGVKNGTAVFGAYSTADLSGYNPSDPSTAPSASELLTAKGISVIGAYGKRRSAEGPGRVLRGHPEGRRPERLRRQFVGRQQAGRGPGVGRRRRRGHEVPGGQGHQPGDQEDADRLVLRLGRLQHHRDGLPGDNTADVSKDTAVSMTTKLRKEVRVKL